MGGTFINQVDGAKKPCIRYYVMLRFSSEVACNSVAVFSINQIARHIMTVKEEFENLVERLKVDRDEINLKLHLASMEVRDEFEAAEKKWAVIKAKAAEVADDTREVSEEVVTGAKIVAEELKEAYRRISRRLSE